MPNSKDFLVKVKDLPTFDGLKLDKNNILHIPDATISLAERTEGGTVISISGLSKDNLNLISADGTKTVTIQPDNLKVEKIIEEDVEAETEADYFKFMIDATNKQILLYDTDRLDPVIIISGNGVEINDTLISGITSINGNSTTLAASQALASSKQNRLTAGENITIENDVISATLSEVANMVGIEDPVDGIGTTGMLYLKYTQEIDKSGSEPVYIRDITSVFGNIAGTWYEFPEGSVNLFGTDPPAASQGDNGSIYMQYNNQGITQVYGKVNDTWYPFGGGSVDPEIENKVQELDETAVRIGTSLLTSEREELETTSDESLETVPKNDIYGILKEYLIPNSTKPTTRSLSSLQIGENNYNINGGGGGGGSTVSITPTHHYSTNEQVIGTWIDGSTIYECTYAVSFTLQAGGAWSDTGISFSSYDKVFSAEAVCNDVYVLCSTTKLSSSNNIGVSGTHGQNVTRTVNYLTLRYTKN